MSRILVVEDERHLADGLRFNLEAKGYQVEVVETGEEALEVLIGVHPKSETASQGTKYIEWSEVWTCPELSTVASQTSHDELASF